MTLLGSFIKSRTTKFTEQRPRAFSIDFALTLNWPSNAVLLRTQLAATAGRATYGHPTILFFCPDSFDTVATPTKFGLKFGN
jgi:hypothetical protein